MKYVLAIVLVIVGLVEFLARLLILAVPVLCTFGFALMMDSGIRDFIRPNRCWEIVESLVR